MVTVRKATVSDSAAIGLAHARAWQVAYKGIIPDGYLDGIDIGAWRDRWSRILTGEIFVEGIEPPENLVAVLDDDVVGFANAGRFRESPDDPNLGELWAMYVHPDHWQDGAGYELMNATMSVFRQHRFERAYLWVLEENSQARRFYERQGWTSEDATRTEEIGGRALASVRYSLKIS